MLFLEIWGIDNMIDMFLLWYKQLHHINCGYNE